jgi:hypothetical protein
MNNKKKHKICIVKDSRLIRRIRRFNIGNSHNSQHNSLLTSGLLLISSIVYVIKRNTNPIIITYGQSKNFETDTKGEI